MKSEFQIKAYRAAMDIIHRGLSCGWSIAQSWRYMRRMDFSRVRGLSLSAVYRTLRREGTLAELHCKKGAAA